MYRQIFVEVWKLFDRNVSFYNSNDFRTSKEFQRQKAIATVNSHKSTTEKNRFQLNVYCVYAYFVSNAVA